MLPGHVIRTLGQFDQGAQVSEYLRETYHPNDTSSPELGPLFACAVQKATVGELYNYVTRGVTTRKIRRSLDLGLNGGAVVHEYCRQQVA